MNCLLTLKSLLLLINTMTVILANNQLDFKCENRHHNCIDIAKCESAMTSLRLGLKPEICGFKESTSYVCCSEEIEYFPVKTKSEEQCEKYYGKFSENPASQMSEVSPTRLRKVAHVITLGAKTNNSIQWVCGGSLISDKFILTAAHCLSSIHGGVNLVRFEHSNVAKYSDILEIIAHPEYTPNSFYNDIALVRIAPLDIYSPYKPACLHHHKFLPPFKQFKVSGYEINDTSNTFSKQLRQVSLKLIDYEECNAVYEKIESLTLEFGIDDQSQICAENKKTFQGESGGSLEYRDFSKTMRPHFMIVGITSLDKSKYIQDKKSRIGVYTRVSKYLPWIEENVWPSEN